jgi:hypothetical protein
MLFLPEEETAEAWEPSKKHFSFRKSGNTGKKTNCNGPTNALVYNETLI